MSLARVDHDQVLIRVSNATKKPATGSGMDKRVGLESSGAALWLRDINYFDKTVTT